MKDYFQILLPQVCSGSFPYVFFQTLFFFLCHTSTENTVCLLSVNLHLSTRLKTHQVCLCLSRSGLSCSLFIHVVRTPPKTRSCWSHPGLRGSLLMFPLCVYVCKCVFSVCKAVTKHNWNTWNWGGAGKTRLTPPHFGRIDSFPVREELQDVVQNKWGKFFIRDKNLLVFGRNRNPSCCTFKQKLHSPLSKKKKKKSSCAQVLNVCMCVWWCVLVAGPWHIHFTVFAGQCNIQHHRITALLSFF